MRVLHLANYYIGSKVYQNLTEHLDKGKIQQIIYVAFENKQLLHSNKASLHTPGSKIIYRAILNMYTRLNYFHKTNKIARDVESTVQLSEIDFVHAHTIFSDGATALSIKEKFNIPYIVAVRNTDTGIFFKYLFYLRKRGLRILQEAEKIIFINPDIRDELVEKFVPSNLKETILNKSLCIPNGVNSFWLEHIAAPKSVKKKRCNIIYVGSFLKRKNVPLVIEAALLLKDKYEITLTIVGSGGKDEQNVLDRIKQAKNKITVNQLGKVTDLSKLQVIYNEADVFVMPSRNETFGLVYIEALSQATPIIFTKKTGVSGFFEDGHVGYGITEFSAQEISEKIEHVISNYDSLSKNAIQAVKPFDWDKIKNQYAAIYQQFKLNKISF